jgi:hypothetical protein
MFIVYTKNWFCTENMPYDVSPGWQAGSAPPIIPASVAQQPVRHNLLLVHLFVTLTIGPAMQHYEIILSKNRTISALMDATFLAIKSTGNIATPYVTTKTVAYIHTLIVDSISVHPSDAFNTRALDKENTVLAVVNEMSLAAFREELFSVLNKYFVDIVKSAGASGRPAHKTFRLSIGAAPGSGDAAGAAPAAAPTAAAAAPTAPATSAAQPPPEAAPAEPSVTATGKQTNRAGKQ